MRMGNVAVVVVVVFTNKYQMGQRRIIMCHGRHDVICSVANANGMSVTTNNNEITKCSKTITSACDVGSGQ